MSNVNQYLDKGLFFILFFLSGSGVVGFVSVSNIKQKNIWVDFKETFRIGWIWYKGQLVPLLGV